MATSAKQPTSSTPRLLRLTSVIPQCWGSSAHCPPPSQRPACFHPYQPLLHLSISTTTTLRSTASFDTATTGRLQALRDGAATWSLSWRTTLPAGLHCYD